MLRAIDFTELVRHTWDLVQSPYMHILFWCIFADIILGYFKAFRTKTFSSNIGSKGIMKHIIIFATMTLAGTYLRFFGLQHISIGICSFFILNYAISLMENWEEAGLPFPESVRPYINQLKKDQDSRIVKTLQVDKLEVVTKEREIYGKSKHSDG